MVNELDVLLADIRRGGDVQQLVTAIPYARLMGMSCQAQGDSLRFLLPAHPGNVGNPLIPALHGGVIGAFMEISASLQLLLLRAEPQWPELIDFSLDYLRIGLLKDTWARCELSRQGSRVANVTVFAWQDDENTAIAMARAHFRIAPA